MIPSNYRAEPDRRRHGRDYNAQSSVASPRTRQGIPVPTSRVPHDTLFFPFGHAPPQRSDPIPIPAPAPSKSVDPLIFAYEHDALQNRGRQRRRVQSNTNNGVEYRERAQSFSLRGSQNASYIHGASSGGEYSGSGSDFSAPASQGSSEIFHFSPDDYKSAFPSAQSGTQHASQGRVPFMYTPPRMPAQAVHDAALAAASAATTCATPTTQSADRADMAQCPICGRMVQTRSVREHVLICEPGRVNGHGYRHRHRRKGQEDGAEGGAPHVQYRAAADVGQSRPRGGAQARSPAPFMVPPDYWNAVRGDGGESSASRPSHRHVAPSGGVQVQPLYATQANANSPNYTRRRTQSLAQPSSRPSPPGYTWTPFAYLP